MTRAVADTSVFIARESGRPLGELPDEIAISVITAAELELGVLRADDPPTRALRLATLSRVRAEYPLLPIDDATATCFARIADEELRDIFYDQRYMVSSRLVICWFNGSKVWSEDAPNHHQSP